MTWSKYKIALYISFSKGLEVDDEVVSKHLPGRFQLSRHKAGVKESKKNLMNDKEIYISNIFPHLMLSPQRAS